MRRNLSYLAKRAPHFVSLNDGARVARLPVREYRRKVVALRLRRAGGLPEALELGEAAWLLACSREAARALLNNGTLGSEPDVDQEGVIVRHRIPRGQVVLLAEDLVEGTAG